MINIVPIFFCAIVNGLKLYQHSLKYVTSIHVMKIKGIRESPL